MFVLLAIPLALYVLYAAATGAVWVRQGPGGRRVARAEEPGYFWTCLGVYAGLAIAMATVF